MEHSTPPSPALSKSEFMVQDLHALLHHNTSGSHPQESLAMGHAQAHAQSQPASRYGTPVPQSLQSQGHDNTAFPYQHRGGGGPLVRMTLRSRDFWLTSPKALQPYSTPATSPPTPSRASDVLDTRSGASLQKGAVSRALGPKSARIEKSTPTKKKKDRTKAAKNLPILEHPMSELTKESQIPVADIETYVNRSTEIRRAEIETGKNPGRVKRPMNAFMLYRKAYQQRAKEWASQHNHQVVSRVCGMSWPLEPETVRTQFKQWADLERDNHQKAHPDYKFTPSKPQKQKLGSGRFDDSEESDLEGYQWNTPNDSRGRSATKTPNYDPDGDYIPPRSVYSQYHQQYRGQQSLAPPTNRSAYEFSNPGKPMPAPYDHRELSSMYYETQIHNQRNAHGNLTEDLIMRKTPSPTFAYQQHMGLSQYSPSQYHNQTPLPAAESLRLPQSSRFDDNQLLPMHHQPVRHAHHQQTHRPYEQPIDPTLPSYDTSNLAAYYDSPASGAHHAWHQGHHGQHAIGEDGEGGQFTDAFNMGIQASGLSETLSVEPNLSVEQRAQFLQHAGDWHIEDVGDDPHGWGDLGKTEAS
ncbi:hypothetical protein B0T14DRAFT_575351 [Immersiella caudata]|uniref:HMG box domain-containing protein n=1 Tax=Immersiella caudata TaxID=314043 RepID=A0AA39XG37_9PEZI|nr:hypothetical protein B0T14DRAFT_575351 [Immersiella caudata]